MSQRPETIWTSLVLAGRPQIPGFGGSWRAIEPVLQGNFDGQVSVY